MRRGYPDGRDHIGCQQSRQDQRIPDVGLHPRTRDLFHFDRVGDQHPLCQRLQQIVDMPGIGGRFDDHVVAGLDPFLKPGFQVCVLDPHRLKSDFALKIHPGGHTVVLMDIQG